MGHNSAVIILHDALHIIEANPITFTSKLLKAIKENGTSLPNANTERVDIGLSGHGNVASLFHVAHANNHQVYLVGGNTARSIKGGGFYAQTYYDAEKEDIKILTNMAEAAGYRLVKKG